MNGMWRSEIYRNLTLLSFYLVNTASNLSFQPRRKTWFW
jgi:hypothetical protein